MALIGRLPRAGGEVGGDSISLRPRQRRSSGKGAVSLRKVVVVMWLRVDGVQV